jgi:AcrR family transcriptional regulator
MAQRVDTDQILAAAVRVISRTGLQKLAMIDVALEAGISRHTLFRRFRTQAEMLDALGDYTVRLFDRNMRSAIAAQPDPAVRVGVVVKGSFDLVRDESLGRLLELEPRYFRTFLKQHFEGCRQTTSALLVSPEPLPDGQRGEAIAEAGELILRYALSLEVAEPKDWAREVELVTRVVEKMLRPHDASTVAQVMAAEPPMARPEAPGRDPKASPARPAEIGAR